MERQCPYPRRSHGLVEQLCCERQGVKLACLLYTSIVKFTSAYATFIRRSGASESNTIVVGRDARISGEMVKTVVCGTLMGMGYDVLNIGLATTPTTELAVTMSAAAGGIIITCLLYTSRCV